MALQECELDQEESIQLKQEDLQLGGEDTCLEELVSHGTVVSLLWEHKGGTVGEGDTAEKEVSLLSKVVFADELDEGGQGEDDLLD